jgi:hypothetical protein
LAPRVPYAVATGPPWPRALFPAWSPGKSTLQGCAWGTLRRPSHRARSAATKPRPYTAIAVRGSTATPASTTATGVCCRGTPLGPAASAAGERDWPARASGHARRSRPMWPRVQRPRPPAGWSGTSLARQHPLKVLLCRPAAPAARSRARATHSRPRWPRVQVRPPSSAKGDAMWARTRVRQMRPVRACGACVEGRVCMPPLFLNKAARRGARLPDGALPPLLPVVAQAEPSAPSHASRKKAYAVTVRWVDHKSARILQGCAVCDTLTAKLWCRRLASPQHGVCVRARIEESPPCFGRTAHFPGRWAWLWGWGLTGRG